MTYSEMRAFREWLDEQVNRFDAIGDIAGEVLDSWGAELDSLSALEEHIAGRHDPAPGWRETLRAAWAEFASA